MREAEGGGGAEDRAAVNVLAPVSGLAGKVGEWPGRGGAPRAR